MQGLQHQIPNHIAVTDEQLVAIDVGRWAEPLGKNRVEAVGTRCQPRLGFALQRTGRRRRALAEQRRAVERHIGQTFVNDSRGFARAGHRARRDGVEVHGHPLEPCGDQSRLRDSQWREAGPDFRIRFGILFIRAMANEIERADVLGGGAERRNEEREREDHHISKPGSGLHDESSLG